MPVELPRGSLSPGGARPHGETALPEAPGRERASVYTEDGPHAERSVHWPILPHSLATLGGPCFLDRTRQACNYFIYLLMCFRLSPRLGSPMGAGGPWWFYSVGAEGSSNRACTEQRGEQMTAALNKERALREADVWLQMFL